MLKRRFVLTLSTLVAVLLLARCGQEEPRFEGSYDTAALDSSPSPIPDRIILTWASDPATSQAFTWRTDATVSEGFVEIAPAEAGPRFMLNRTAHPATYEPFEFAGLQAHSHSVNVTGLDPSTLYAYRVGAGETWSEWFHFRTASRDPEPFSFVYFGDAQNNILSLWSRTVRTAYSESPRARFMIHAGDLINRSDRDSEWGEWFAAAGWIHGVVPSIPTPGNHEYRKQEDGSRALSPLWRKHFTLPPAPIPGLEETTYFIDFQGTRIVSLNSNEKIEEQTEWLDRILQDNPNRWTVVTFHHPIYSTARGRDNLELRAAWQPIFDKYRVDLVLQGHDHTYARGTNLPLGVSGQNPASGTVYVVSVSGPKMYRLDENEWWDRAAENTQLFQVVDVSQESLKYRALTATGEVYDAFELIKQEGQTNLLVSHVPEDVPERRHSNTLGGLPPE